MPITLLYHDVVDRGQDDTSGFPGAGAARYKLTPAEFRDHMQAVSRVLQTPPCTVHELLPEEDASTRVLLTFDDGGRSACAPIADLLDERGWRGHFFITTDYLDTPTFVTSAQVRDLHKRGHVIGSHSCSHPRRLSSCTWEELVREWRQSCAMLAGVLGEPVTTASVPGGFYTRRVGAAAAQAGIQTLFNSEPTTRSRTLDGCRILGRYTVYRGMPAQAAARLASGNLWSRWQQTLFWNAKKMTKAAGGGLYHSLRERLLTRAYSVETSHAIRSDAVDVRK